MSDFQNLSPQMQATLQIKLDGFIEACIHASRVLNIGLSEAMSLTIRAPAREITAHKFNTERANEMWAEVLSEVSATAAGGRNPALN